MKIINTHPMVLTVSESAKLLQLPRFKVYPLIKDKSIEGFKVGYAWRVTRASVERFLNPIVDISPYKQTEREPSYQFRNVKLQSTLIPMLLALLLFSFPSLSYAAGAGMPWEGPLDQILNSLSGPVARAVGVAAIIVTGLGIAFGEGGGGMRKMLWVVFGLTIAFSATSFFLSFFGGSSGATF